MGWTTRHQRSAQHLADATQRVAMATQSMRSVCPGAFQQNSSGMTIAKRLLTHLHLQRLSSKAAIAEEAHKWSQSGGSSVPPLLHQSWKNCSVPLRQRMCQQRCDTILPQNWSMWLWTDQDNRAFIAREFPSFLELYDNYDVHIKRVDAVRYFYLYRYGGVCE